jgi:hypothetical protein
MRRSAAPTLLLAAALLPGGGCGRSSADPLPTVPVKGKVTYKGQPLVRGSVTFEPHGAGREAFGEIGADGTYVLTTSKEGDGTVAGPHRVSVTGGTGKGSAGKIPSKYSSLTASGLEIEVSPDKTDYPIDLK